MPDQLRVGVLTGRDSVYAPLVLEQLEEVDVVAVWSRASGGSRIEQVRRSLRRSGLRYTIARIVGALRSGRTRSVDGAIEIESANTPEFRDELADADLDVLVSVFYPEILDEDLLDVPRLAALNVHPGALPEFAGNNPVFWTLAEGEDEATVVVHKMTAEVDAGPVVATDTVPVPSRATLDGVYREVATAGGQLLREVLVELATLGDVPTSPGTPPKRIRTSPTAAGYQEFRRRGHRIA